jgi:hypothetical protein
MIMPSVSRRAPSGLGRCVSGVLSHGLSAVGAGGTAAQNADQRESFSCDLTDNDGVGVGILVGSHSRSHPWCNSKSSSIGRESPRVDALFRRGARLLRRLGSGLGSLGYRAGRVWSLSSNESPSTLRMRARRAATAVGKDRHGDDHGRI